MASLPRKRHLLSKLRVYRNSRRVARKELSIPEAEKVESELFSGLGKGDFKDGMVVSYFNEESSKDPELRYQDVLIRRAVIALLGRFMRIALPVIYANLKIVYLRLQKLKAVFRQQF